MNSLSGITNSSKKAKKTKTGNRLELFVENILKEYGYVEFWNHKASAFANRKNIGGKQYMKHLNVGKTIYETDRKVDFFIVNREKFPDGLIIECKWQQNPGSVDEKYPFLLLNIIKTAVPTVILLDGTGYKPAAKQWLKDQVNHVLIGVWSMSEFQKETNNGFL